MTIQKKDQFNRNESPTFYSCPGELNQCRAATSYLVEPPMCGDKEMFACERVSLLTTGSPSKTSRPA